MSNKPAMTFSLRSLLAAFVVIAAGTGALGGTGLIPGLLIVGSIAALRWRTASPWEWAFTAVILVVLVALLVPATKSASDPSRAGRCRNNLRRIAMGLHLYQQQYGTFPPAYVPGPDGRPWHSWRVLLLPFLQHEALYAEYDFKQPWDGPRNAKLALSMPTVYVCPLTDGHRTGRTTYLAVVGEGTVWPGPKSRPIDEITDYPGQTILVLELPGEAVPWTEPRDVDFHTIAAAQPPNRRLVGPGGHRPKSDYFLNVEDAVVHAATVDGCEYDISCDAIGKPLAPLLTASGGEETDIDQLAPTYRTRYNWPRIFSLVALAVSAPWFWWTTRPRATVEQRRGGELTSRPMR